MISLPTWVFVVVGVVVLIWIVREIYLHRKIRFLSWMVKQLEGGEDQNVVDDDSKTGNGMG